jgi:YHS domain-containing protein
VAFYVATVGVVSGSLEHARDLLFTDWPLVLALGTGFGAQLGLYAQLRRAVHPSRAVVGAAGVGTGTSTAAMVACCAHHLTDVVPALGLPAMAGTAAALARWRVPFMVLGVLANLAGIGYHLQLLRRVGRGEAIPGKEGKAIAEQAKDPVYGMEVDPERAAGASEYGGPTYYFCSAHCKAAFDREPERYVRKGG